RRGRVATALAAVALTASAIIPLAATSAGAATSGRAARAGAAPDGPGAMSYFDLARKDCVGTARNTSSKVWYTVAGGVLSDTYEPTIDNTNVSTLQYVVTDGSSFTDLQTRDMTYTVSADPTGMACTVTATDAAHGYRLTTTYITDPARDTVLMNTRLSAIPGSGTNTVTDAVNRTYAVPTYMAMAASRPAPQASVGYAGTASDGLTQLDTARTLTTYTSAPDGHVVATEELTPARDGTITLALGFGRTQGQAVGTANDSLRSPFFSIEQRYLGGWSSYDRGLRRPPVKLPGEAAGQARRLDDTYYLSANVIKASEDKTFPGAIVASLASPWGQSVPAGTESNGEPAYFGSYREVFARDLYEAFTGLLVDGDLATARAAVRFLFDRQQLASGSMPRNSLLNGRAAPDTGGLQLDETSYPILMALQAGLGGDAQLWRDHIRPAADFLVASGPTDGVERWEEQTGYS